jgi:hypothetical protein
LLAVAAAAAVEVADVAVAAADVEVAAVHVPVAAFPLPEDPRAPLDRVRAVGQVREAGQAREVGRARAVGRVRAVDRARALGRVKAAAKRLRDLREVAHPVANRLPRDLREVVHLLGKVRHAPRPAQRVRALRLDNAQRPAPAWRTALLAAVQPLVS